MTAAELAAILEELGREMDDPNLTPETEAQIVEAMERAESQLDALGYNYDGTPYDEPEFENRAYLAALPKLGQSALPPP